MALDRLHGLPPTARRKTLAAVKAVIEHDRKLTVEEIELFRAIAAALDCPIPPLAITAAAMR
jgi:hypothetical protein